MRKKNPEVDAYIQNAAPFAQPILKRIRRAYHKACPQIEETIKWGVPCFEYKGIVGNMGAFKQHVSFGFWKGQLLSDSHGLLRDAGKATIFSLKASGPGGLPDEKILIEYIREAVALNDKGIKPSRTKKASTRPKLPADFKAALSRNRAARSTYDGFTPSCQREYVEWINEAKRETTRERRIATAVEWLAEGKKRNWKYERK